MIFNKTTVHLRKLSTSPVFFFVENGNYFVPKTHSTLSGPQKCLRFKDFNKEKLEHVAYYPKFFSMT